MRSRLGWQGSAGLVGITGSRRSETARLRLAGCGGPVMTEEERACPRAHGVRSWVGDSGGREEGRVQHTLLGLALILIAAIAAALAAPAFVDWNAWRTTFESRASALAGAPVKIRGDISATILPQPSFLLNDIEIGGPAGLRAAQLQGLLSLGPLMRGVIEAEELVLRRPSMGVVIDGGGQVTFPLPGPRLAVDQLAISRISIINGTLRVEDRASGAVHEFEDIRASGELRSLLGPFRLDVSAMLKDRRWSARINLGRVGPDSSGRLRLSVESAEAGISLDADGTLALADAVPRFDGKTTIAWRAGSGPARISMNVRASAALVLVEGLQLTLANSEAPIDLTGQVRLEPPARRIDGMLAARRIDLDRPAAAPNVPRGFGPAFATLKDLVALAGALPYSGRLGFTVENLSAGGGVLREVRADLLRAPGGPCAGAARSAAAGPRPAARDRERARRAVLGRGAARSGGAGWTGALAFGCGRGHGSRRGSQDRRARYDQDGTGASRKPHYVRRGFAQGRRTRRGG